MIALWFCFRIVVGYRKLQPNIVITIFDLLDLIPSLLVKNRARNKSALFASVLGWSYCLCPWFETKLFPLLHYGTSPCFFWSSSFSLPFWCPTTFVEKELKALTSTVGPSWSWSYGSWIYKYLCNQCLSSLALWVRIPLMARCIRYIMWSSL